MSLTRYNLLFFASHKKAPAKKPVAPFTPAPSPYEKHVGFFSNEEGDDTLESMQEKLLKLGMKPEEAALKATTFMIAGGMAIKQCPFSKFTAQEAVGKFAQTGHSGIFKEDGSINEQIWKLLLEFTEIDQGIQVISKTNIYKFLASRRQSNKIHQAFNQAYEISNEEWEDFFALFTNHWKTVDGQSEPCVTVKLLRNFYENSGVEFQKVAERQTQAVRL